LQNNNIQQLEATRHEYKYEFVKQHSNQLDALYNVGNLAQA